MGKKTLLVDADLRKPVLHKMFKNEKNKGLTNFLSDSENILLNSLKMPYFEIENKIYFKRSTLIVEKNIVKKVFYPIFPPNKHINEVLQWLKEN